jgi:fumarylacetoacetase
LATAGLASTNFRLQYWALAQMVTQHTVGGCNLHPGELLGTGIISGPTPTEVKAIVEVSQGVSFAFDLLGTGEQRCFF